jgi:hypothetical protein
VRRGSYALGLLCVLGCGDANGGARPAANGGNANAPDVVSTVNGAVIRVRDVQALTRKTSLSAPAALRRLQAERLLEQEAERRGYDAASSAQYVSRQALVQVLLAHDVEAEPVSDAEIAAAYAAAGTRFATPEKRASTHVLAMLPKGATAEQEQAASTFAETACKRLLAVKGDAAMTAALDELRDAKPPQFKVVVQTLPAVAREGAFVPAFSEALFSVPGRGVVAQPVRSEFGFHVIVITDIVPSVVTPLEAASDTLRDELTTSKRQRRLASSLGTLSNRTPVNYPDGGPRALAALEL